MYLPQKNVPSPGGVLRAAAAKEFLRGEHNMPLCLMLTESFSLYQHRKVPLWLMVYKAALFICLPFAIYMNFVNLFVILLVLTCPCCSQILEGFHYIHSRRIVHNAIQPCTIGVVGDGVADVKIMNFTHALDVRSGPALPWTRIMGRQDNTTAMSMQVRSVSISSKLDLKF